MGYITQNSAVEKNHGNVQGVPLRERKRGIIMVKKVAKKLHAYMQHDVLPKSNLSQPKNY